MKKYYALMFDVVKSRKLSDEDRFDVQNKLDITMKIINNLFEKNIIKPIKFSAGDSAQGLFDSIAAVHYSYLLVKNAVFPYKVRAGIGYGKINPIMINQFHDDDSNKYDGEAYHFAKDAIELAKKENKSLLINIDKQLDSLLNPILNDEELISMTVQRKAIYSLINLIDPLINNKYQLNESYFRMISPLITNITNCYRKNSRTKNQLFDKTIISFELGETEVKKYLIKYHHEVFNYSMSKKEDSNTINKFIRALLVNLSSSKEQNINSLIKNTQMDILRKRTIAKTKMMELFYEGRCK